MGKITAAITGVGLYLPDYILTNEELSTMVDTSDEWIMSHIGVKTRHILKGEGVGTSYMGARAVINLLDKAGVDPMEVDLVICATVTPDMFFPSTGNLIADQAGCKNAFAYDVSAACSGFLFALTTGAKFIESGSCKKVVVVGADKMSTIVDYTDRSTCPIFGDGAAAVLLEPNTEGYGVLDEILRSDTARLMLANSELLVMLNQAATDREELAKLLNISENQLSYITNVPAGHGLIRCGGAIIPFENSFPKNTKLYQLMTTKPNEKFE